MRPEGCLKLGADRTVRPRLSRCICNIDVYRCHLRAVPNLKGNARRSQTRDNKIPPECGGLI